MRDIVRSMQGQPALDLADSTFTEGADAKVSAARIRQEHFLQRDLFQCSTIHGARLICRPGGTSEKESGKESPVALLRSKNPDERVAALEHVLSNPTATSDADVALLFASRDVTGRELQLIARLRPVPSEIAVVALSNVFDTRRDGTRADLRRSIQRMRAAGEVLQAYDALNPEQKELLAKFASNQKVPRILREPFAPFQQQKPQGYLSDAIRLLGSNSAAIRDSGVRMLQSAPELMRSMAFEEFASVFDRTLDLLNQDPLLACERLQDYGAAFRILLETPATQITACSFLLNTLQDHPVFSPILLNNCQRASDRARGDESVATFFTSHALETPQLARLDRLGDAASQILVRELERRDSAMPFSRLRMFLAALS